MTVPLMMDVSASLEETLKPQELNDELVRIRKALYHDLGVPFPGIHLRYNETLPAGAYRIMLQEIPVAEGLLKEGHLLAREEEDNLLVLGCDYPGPDRPGNDGWYEMMHQTRTVET